MLHRQCGCCSQIESVYSENDVRTERSRNGVLRNSPRDVLRLNQSHRRHAVEQRKRRNLHERRVPARQVRERHRGLVFAGPSMHDLVTRIELFVDLRVTHVMGVIDGAGSMPRAAVVTLETPREHICRVRSAH
jgi:hypothetical protein